MTLVFMLVLMGGFYCIGYLVGYERGIQNYHDDYRKY